MRGSWLLLALTATSAAAETGPPRPSATSRSPAQQAIDLYRQGQEPKLSKAPCRAASAGEVIVCGRDDRLPFPDDRGARDVPRTATGEPPRAARAGLAQVRPAGVGLTLTLPLGRNAKARVTGNR